MTNAPIDPETGLPVRNWPAAAEPKAKRPRRKDDKDANGNWTAEAKARYGGQFNDGTPLDGEWTEDMADAYMRGCFVDGTEILFQESR